MEQEGYTYLGIIELDKIKESEMKKRLIKEKKRKLRLFLRSKLNDKKVAAINTWEVAVFIYGAGILSCRVHELNSINRKTRKWPSGPASSIGLTEVKHGCVRSETGWATSK